MTSILLESLGRGTRAPGKVYIQLQDCSSSLKHGCCWRGARHVFPRSLPVLSRLGFVNPATATLSTPTTHQRPPPFIFIFMVLDYVD